MREHGTDVVIVGGGPAALALALEFQRLNIGRERFRVLDPSGRWLAQWDRQMATTACGVLRCPLPHHPAPDPLALETFLLTRREAVPVAGMSAHATTAQFAAFAASLQKDAELTNAVEAERVRGLELELDAVSLDLESGKRLMARYVVLAHNPRRVRLPDWARARDGLPIFHASDCDLAHAGTRGERIGIVGGGHSGGSLALAALARGCDVMLLMQRPLRQQKFDVEPGWLTPGRLRGFLALPLPARIERALAARRGGSMPSFVVEQLLEYARAGQLELIVDEIVSALDVHGAVNIETRLGRTAALDQLWLATGSEPDGDDPLFQAVRRARPDVTHRGYPLLSSSLRWPGTNVYVTSTFALARVGPTAGNLHGHRWAAQLIARDIAAAMMNAAPAPFRESPHQC